VLLIFVLLAQLVNTFSKVLVSLNVQSAWSMESAQTCVHQDISQQQMAVAINAPAIVYHAKIQLHSVLNVKEVSLLLTEHVFNHVQPTLI
jgi:Na+-transporting methylmalonyl-CoA/oxaloacetate decarboxylase gamma subunit